MARSIRGLYKRGNTLWMSYRDAIGIQRFEYCNTTSKKDAELRLFIGGEKPWKGAPRLSPCCSRYLNVA